MKISQSSWHYRLMFNIGVNFNEVKTVCQYMRKFFLCVVLPVVVIFMVCYALGYMTGDIFYHSESWADEYLLSPLIGAVSFSAFIAVLYLCVQSFNFCIYFLVDTADSAVRSLKQRREEKQMLSYKKLDSTQKEPGLVKMFIKTRKEKMCHTVEFTE